MKQIKNFDIDRGEAFEKMISNDFCNRFVCLRELLIKALQ